jgi:hypothetical protein
MDDTTVKKCMQMHILVAESYYLWYINMAVKSAAFSRIADVSQEQ